MSSLLPQTDCKPVSVWLSSPDRLWAYVLVAIAGAALIPMVIRAVGETVDYDGFWHLFIASQDRWELFLFEYKNNAHPPLFMLLLRVPSLFGHSRLAIATEYYAVFFVLACIACVPLVFATRHGLSDGRNNWTAQTWGQVLLAMILPLATITYFHQTHIRHLPIFPHVIEFYWMPG